MNSFKQRIGALLGTQFLTVVNDSIFKQVLLLMALGGALSTSSEAGETAQARAAMLFSLPFLLFAVTAGDCADRWSKAMVVRWAKMAEAIVMLFASFALANGHPIWISLCLFLMGLQSAFLGPAKYGLLPELCPPTELAKANAYMQGTVVAGIVLGTGMAGYLKTNLSDSMWVLGCLLACVALWGYSWAKRIPQVPASRPQNAIRWNPIQRLHSVFKVILKVRGLLPAMLLHSACWFGGSLLLLAWNELIVPLNVSPGAWSAALASLSLFLALGALLGGRLSTARLNPKTVFWGAIGMGCGYGAIAILPTSAWLTWASASLGAFLSGLYLIPLRTWVQRLAPVDSLGSILGASQMLDFFGITLTAILRGVILQFVPGPFAVFAFLGVFFFGMAWLASKHLLPLKLETDLKR